MIHATADLIERTFMPSPWEVGLNVPAKQTIGYRIETRFEIGVLGRSQLIVTQPLRWYGAFAVSDIDTKLQ